MRIDVLDCTLRDGGYVNNWEFGSLNITSIISRLNNAGIEIIECGYLSKINATTKERSVFFDISAAEKMIPDSISSKAALMINYGEYSAEMLPVYSGGKVGVIRVAFHKEDVEQALQLCADIKTKGYMVFVQPMVTISYSDSELLKLIDRVNDICADAMYIVDSFGSMTEKDVMRIMLLINNNLSESIKLGFHSHNNLQLSFSNSQRFLELSAERSLIIDSSIYGMGRGAGNLCTELICKYISDNYSQEYRLIDILEAIEEYINPIFMKTPWGYSVAYYIASVNHCHPNYATYLSNKQTMPVRAINEIITSIPQDKKNTFDESLIKELYFSHNKVAASDENTRAAIKKRIGSRSLLLIGSGSSVIKQADLINQYISENRPFVISVNYLPKNIPVDVAFFNNAKRFLVCEEHGEIPKADDLLVTSNLMGTVETPNVAAYEKYLCGREFVADNGMLILVNFLMAAGFSEFALAGFDGYSIINTENYARRDMAGYIEPTELIRRNREISLALRENKDANFVFVTDSIYKNYTEADNE